MKFIFSEWYIEKNSDYNKAILDLRIKKYY